MLKRALEGVRVADFTWVAAGPISTKFIALMGAEVIKIETASRAERRASNHNVSKLSCTLNVSQPQGLALAKELIKKSDIVIDNFAYGVMERLGLGYEALREVKPDIIVVSASGLGKTGPYRGHVAYGKIVAMYSGIDSITGYEEDGRPRGTGHPWGDPLTGIYLAFAMLAALTHKKRTGEGQYVEYSMTEGIASLLPEAFLDYTVHGQVWGTRGNMEEGAAPHNCYPCQGEDKWVAIAVTTEDEWAGFCRALGNPSWCQEDRFADGYRRFQHRQELDSLVGEWTKQHTAYQVMEILQAEGVPAGPSLNGQELVEDPHLLERGLYIPIELPGIGPGLAKRVAWELHPNPAGYEYGRVPTLGQDNSYVFGEVLGLPEAEITTLVEQGIIA